MDNRPHGSDVHREYTGIALAAMMMVGALVLAISLIGFLTTVSGGRNVMIGEPHDSKTETAVDIRREFQVTRGLDSNRSSPAPEIKPVS